MSNVPHRSKEDGLPQQHPTFIDLSKTPPAPDLTPYITKINNQCVAGGGFGDVYKCRYLNGSTSEEVAVKALRFAPDEDTKNKHNQMVRRELGVWKRLRHNNIVPFLGIAYGFGMDGATSSVSLWMPNDTLHKFLKTHGDKLDVVHRLQILLDIAKGLDYLHSFPIVHGDLNSNNVLIDADYTARLADFGYASLVGNIPEALGYLQRSTTRPGALRWNAPEQIELEGPSMSSIRTTKSDIYSFGCVALEGSLVTTYVKPILISLQVLSGKQPWSEVREDAAIVLRLYLGHKPGRPESRTIVDSHWNVIQCCWSPLQERPSADIIILFIQQFLSDYPSSGPLRDLFISPCSQAQDSLSGSSLSLAAEQPPSVLATTTSPLNRANPPPAHDRASRPIDSAVSTTYSSASRLPRKIQNGGTDGPRAAPAVESLNTSTVVAPKASPPSQSRVSTTRMGWGVWNRIGGIFPTFQLNDDDMVVFVVGPSGSGKSTFVRTATQSPSFVEVGNTLKPRTQKVQAIRCVLQEKARVALGARGRKNIVFVDTPSFHAEENSRADKEMNAWLEKSRSRSTLFRTIYMHRIDRDPNVNREFSIQMQLDAFAYAFPKDYIPWAFPGRVHCVFSYAGRTAPRRMEDRKEKFQSQLSCLDARVIHGWKPTWNTSIHPHLFIKSDPDTAWEAVKALFAFPEPQ